MSVADFFFNAISHSALYISDKKPGRRQLRTMSEIYTRFLEGKIAVVEATAECYTTARALQAED